jgi:hypothetical protein
MSPPLSPSPFVKVFWKDLSNCKKRKENTTAATGNYSLNPPKKGGKTVPIDRLIVPH